MAIIYAFKYKLLIVEREIIYPAKVFPKTISVIKTNIISRNSRMQECKRIFILPFALPKKILFKKNPFNSLNSGFSEEPPLLHEFHLNIIRLALVTAPK